LMSFTQGLLQHYGWRSFFVDLSSDAAVAAWFASHSFKSRRRWDLCENVREEPALLSIQAASYDLHEGNGHLFVLSKALLKQHDHVLVSLIDELTTDCSTRFQTQKAWLAGIYRLQRRLAPATIIAQIIASASVFREFPRSKGFSTTDDLFPSPDQDRMLNSLLSLPRQQIKQDDQPFPLYRRSLDIPEYQDSFVKHLPVTTALFTPFWLSDVVAAQGNEMSIHVPEELFYSNCRIDQPLPQLSKILRQNDVTNIETKELICYPPLPNSVSYEKGVSIRRVGKNMFEVCAISVDYESERFIGWSVAKGYRYELVNMQLIRQAAPTDCPCGDPKRHDHYLRALAVLDDLLVTATIKQTGNIIHVIPR
jgi:hypothetical protein